LKAKKVKADRAKKVKDSKLKEKEKKQEQRDLEKKRRKRMREREKALKGVQHQKKKMKLSDPAPGRRHLIVSKRERAEAIVDGYISRTAKKGDYKSLSLGGGEEKWIPSAVIDSTNLSGMALAFRAAAGLVPIPNPLTNGPGKKIIKPWDTISVKGKKSSDERCEILSKQIKMLEKEIEIVKVQKAKRTKLLEEAKQEADRASERISKNELLARENPLKKSKKPHPLAGKKRKRSVTSAIKREKHPAEDAETNEDVQEVEAVESNDVLDDNDDTPGDEDEEDVVEAVIAE
jgi:hypothetical protein